MALKLKPKKQKQNTARSSAAKVKSGKKNQANKKLVNYRLRRTRVSVVYSMAAIGISGLLVVGLVLWNNVNPPKEPLVSLEVKDTNVSIGEPFIVQVYANS